MGYTTDFWGEVAIDPPLNAEEIKFLQAFNETRRMDRTRGPYYVDGSGDFGQGRDPDIRDFNRAPAGQPSLWCNWTVDAEGSMIQWDGGEKFYSAGEWMIYIIDHFLRPGAIAKNDLPFLQANHVCNGVINAQGEAHDDRWRIVVEDNHVQIEQASVTWA